jgi:hypothetical protein
VNILEIAAGVVLAELVMMAIRWTFGKVSHENSTRLASVHSAPADVPVPEEYRYSTRNRRTN